MKDRSGNEIEVGARVALLGKITREHSDTGKVDVELDQPDAEGKRVTVTVDGAGYLDARDPVDHHEEAQHAAAEQKGEAQHSRQVGTETPRKTKP